MRREQRLVQVFVEVADTLVEEFDLVEFLQTLTERCLEMVDADAAGLLLSDQRGGLQLVTATDEPSRLLELFQLQADQGPCLDAFASGRQRVNIHLAAERERWPDFVDTALELGFETSHALPMRLRGEVVGAMNLFTSSPAELSADHVAVAQGLADLATIGLVHERTLRDQVALSEQLQHALDSRVLVEQAKGVLSARSGTSVGEAFAVMRGHARRSGRTLASVARDVVDGSDEVAPLWQARS